MSIFTTLICLLTLHQHPKEKVVVYGGTPGGIAAALSLGQKGEKVLLIEPTSRIGGLLTNGLSHSDFRTFEGLTGTFLHFSKEILKYYQSKYGKDSIQTRECFRGTHAEPHVNLLVLKKMLARYPSVTVRHGLRLEKVSKSGNRIATATFVDASQKHHTIRADLWIDATYEGDLMALAGVDYRVGREARSRYGESLAPPKADKQVQGYNFRLIATRNPKNRVMPIAPKGYRRKDYLPLLKLLKTGQLRSVFCYPSGGIYKAHIPVLPNGKYDVNDVSRGLVRLSLPDINNDWPEGDARKREQIFQQHVRHNVGMLYFLQNDQAVPEKFQKEAREWGWCKDELRENGHLPLQLYVREARRMTGQYILTQKDTEHAKDDARAVLHRDAIAMGDYGPNCHGTDHVGPRFGGRHTGEFYKPVPPYQIPYGALIPKKCRNLLVPVACSCSHVGLCTVRYEPIWMSLGQAAGFAAHLALRQKIAVQKVKPSEVQRLLHRQGAATIYVSDVLPGDRDFGAVQWWGQQGGLHGLSPHPKKAGQRGKHLKGQYYHAFPGHALEKNRKLDNKLRKRWMAILKELGLKADGLQEAKTRGEFIQSAYQSLSRNR